MKLTQREQQVAELAAQAKQNKEIAAALGISLGTVKIYLGNIYSKFGVKGKPELIRRFSTDIADI